MLFATSTVFHHGPVEEAAFAAVLYIAVFCCLSLLIAPPANASPHQDWTSQHSNAPYPDKLENNADTPNSATATETKPPIDIPQDPEIIFPDSSDAIDEFLQGLGYRKARKAAKALNIRQKANGKYKRVEQLKREIRQALQKDGARLPQVQSSTA
jgi:hypothetical protein